ncbi:putative B3 domain-containing protein At5g58280 [Argentina anserina]|uniref:putative B3 domain-containing protein At5g58280 n=1 Tax=Argentina anserina TaxID=57926 RepID=UPI0021766876|nr:putative B3 domain-containing protein At5g58280 [Potentilla anserina]
MVAAYEEARNKRLEENRKKFQELGITQVSKTLSDLTASEKKPQQQRVWKPKAKNTAFEVEPRRSTRERNPIQSYADEADIGPPTRKRLRSSSSTFGSYLARPLEECRMASFEERTAAFRAAERLQESLQSEHPCFVKSMVRSHVYSCFWLGLPSKFCEDHLPKSDTEFVLEDEDGEECDAKYIARRAGLSGGWRGFALDRKLDDGDALVFELVEPARFKIYITKVKTQEHCKKDKVKNAGKPSKAAKKPDRDCKILRRSKRATSPEIIDMKTPPELLPESPKIEAAVPYKLRRRA